MAKYIFLTLFLLFPYLSKAQIALYNDGGYGTWQDGLTALEQFLTWKGVAYTEVNADTVNNTDWPTRYQAICFPGGYAYYYKLAIDSNGIQKIRQFVNDGGSYLGICAGAYFASDSVQWEEDGLLDYPLDLFDGAAIGAIDSIAPWDNYTMTQVNLNPNHPINQYEPAFEIILYYGGPYFRKHAGAAMDTVGTWQSYHDLPGIITFNYGNGRVLLMGPHPENEEDSDRDSTTFADELDDQGSDWPFLWSAIDWLLGQPITYPGASALPGFSKEHKVPGIFTITLSPNPFNSKVKVTINSKRASDDLQLRLFDALGRLVEKKVVRHPSGKTIVHFNLDNRPSGTYFLQVRTKGSVLNRKLTLIK